MNDPAPHDDFSHGASRSALPTLQLPPVPFARPAAPVAVPVGPAAPAPSRTDTMPSGSTIDDIINALRMEPVPQLEEMLHAPAPMVEPHGDDGRPHAGFHAAIERRNRRERRTSRRETPDRRHFASEHLAAPTSGPDDPRPTAPPQPASSLPMPISTIMPELPSHEPLQPVLPYQLPSRGIAADTMRSTRPGFAAATSPFPTAEVGTPEHSLEQPPAPTSAPEPPTAPAPPQVTAAQGIEGIFGSAQEVGRLEPFAMPTVTTIPDAGPSGPALAPGMGLDPVVATAAASPSAWFGGQVQVDEAMLVWNAPGATAPLAPAVAAAIAPVPVASGAPPAAATTAARIATTTLAPGAPPARGAATGAAPAAGRSPLAGLLRLLAWLGIPAGAGIGIAVALDRLVF